jgi:hypothetical protein
VTPAIAAALPIDAATDAVFELIDTHRKAHAEEGRLTPRGPEGENRHADTA